MRYLRLFEGYQSESEVAKICKEYGINNWTLNSDGLVDVDDDVNLYGMIDRKSLTKLPLKFGQVTGYFSINNNELTSLEGAPHSVGGFFSCEHNRITSLEFAPKLLSNNFRCSYNKIRSFEGLINIGNSFYCTGNPLKEIWDIINPIDNKWDNEKMDFFNDLDIIRGEEIAIDRFNFFLEEIGREPVEEVEGYKNIY
jgi:hypothetical protein